MTLPAVIRAGAHRERGIHREVLHAWMENRSREALISFVFISLSGYKEEEGRGEREPPPKRGRMNYEGIIWLHTDIFDSRQGPVS